MGLITENNAHYYSGQQAYIEETGGTDILIQWNGDVALKPTITGVQNSNYEVFKNNVLLTEFTEYSLTGSIVNIRGLADCFSWIIISLPTPRPLILTILPVK